MRKYADLILPIAVLMFVVYQAIESHGWWTIPYLLVLFVSAIIIVELVSMWIGWRYRG